MTGRTMRQVVLAHHPRGNPVAADFRIETVPVPEPAEGEVLLRNLYLSLDPLIRFALDEKPLSGIAHHRPGDVIYGGTVSEIVASNHPDYAAGDVVEGRAGWREYAALDPINADRVRGPLRKLDPSLAPISTALGVLGMPGQTAHASVIGAGRVAEGETVLISAAAGAVGSLAGQIARIRGARTIGIAGGPDKCTALAELGFDAAVDYKSGDFADRLAEAAGDGVDLYIDNVGGEVSRAVWPCFRRGGRMLVCGYIAYYGFGMEGPGPDHLPGLYRTIMAKGLTISGFAGSFVGGQQALDDNARWLAEDKLRYPERIVEGLDKAPEAFAGIFSGNDTVGKLLVKL